MALIKNCMRGFSGGPDFASQRNVTFQLENVDFLIGLPVSNIVTEEPPRDINFPFQQRGWFEQNQEQHRQHKHVHVYTEIWVYLPVITVAPDSEYGQLTLSVWLKRTPESVNALDLKALGAVLTSEYDQHYNSPTVGGPGEHGIGLNTEIRNEISAQSLARATPFSDERHAEEVRLSIEAFGAPPIAPAKTVSINGLEWVFYCEDNPNPERTRSREDFFCLPLDERFYLQLRFKHRVDRSDKKAWQKHANQAQQRIMESVTVKRAP